MAPTLNEVGSSGIAVSRLCLGANVFGWTADRDTSFAVLDAYTAAGGNVVDTADSYFWRAPGNSGGESETIIGEWLAARWRRDDVVIATKVGSWPRRRGLSAANIAAACDDSLRRLRTDRIDLYYAHRDDPDTAQEETLDAFDALVRAGKVRAVAASNYSAARLAEAQETARTLGVGGYSALQMHYNLMEREVYEGELRGVVEAQGLGTLPYFGLAKGFLTGKYRAGERVDSPRAAKASQYVGEKGDRVLSALGEVAQEHGVPGAAVALRWLADQPAVTAPIASARSVEQLADLLPMRDLVLTDEQRKRLTDASS